MKVVARLRNRELHSSFGTWQSRTADAQEEKNCMRRALSYFTNRSLASAFARWMDFIAEIFDLREKFTKAVTAFAMRAQVASFRGWAHAVDTMKAHREKVRKVLGKVMNRELNAAWATWGGYVDYRLKKDLAKGHYINQMLRCSLEGFVRSKQIGSLAAIGLRKLLNRQLSQAWGTWIEAVEEQQEMAERAEVLKHKVLRRMQMGAAAAAFNAMADHTEQMKRLRSIMYLSLIHI